MKLVCNWGINDNPAGDSRRWVDGKSTRWSCPLTRSWSSAVMRCFDEAYKEKNPTYKNSVMSEDWKYLSNFKSWAADKYQEGLVLDKDILIQGNKLYSPETCVFVPQYVNTCVAKPTRKITRGYKLGVNERKGTYISQISSDGKKLHLGVFTSQDAAHIAWQQAKVCQLEVVVNRYATEPWFNSKVAEAIMSRVWNIRLQISRGEETTFL